MWPRLLEYLPKILDSIPHIERFSQVGERLLSARVSTDAAHAATMDGVHLSLGKVDEALSTLAGDVRQIATANAASATQLERVREQAETAAETAAEARTAAIAVGQSIVGLDRELRSLRALVLTTLVAVVLIALMLGWLLLSRSR